MLPIILQAQVFTLRLTKCNTSAKYCLNECVKISDVLRALWKQEFPVNYTSFKNTATTCHLLLSELLRSRALQSKTLLTFGSTVKARANI